MDKNIDDVTKNAYTTTKLGKTAKIDDNDNPKHTAKVTNNAFALVTEMVAILAEKYSEIPNGIRTTHNAGTPEEKNNESKFVEVPTK
jgi:hypothetical protein